MMIFHVRLPSVRLALVEQKSLAHKSRSTRAIRQKAQKVDSEAGKSKDLNLAPGTYTFHEEATQPVTSK